MSSAMGAAFGAAVCLILLGLFSITTFYMASEVVSLCSTATACTPPTSSLFGDGMTYVVTTVGGLVSALVVAQLTITEPGQAPTIGTFTPTSRMATTAVNGVVGLYLLAWIATGLSALVIGVMIYPKISSTLSDIGTTWLGLAVSAAYAYFGISPGNKKTANAGANAGGPSTTRPTPNRE